MKNFYLITGGSGFIGTNLCKHLTKNNFVINIDKRTYSSVPEKFKKINVQNYKFIKADIGNQKVVRKIFLKYKIDFVVNLAAETHVDRSIDEAKTFIKKNIISNVIFIDTIKELLAKKLIKKKFKFIHISTDEVYGDRNRPVKEGEKYLPNSPYSASKASIDLILRSFFKTFNFPAIICHPSNNYGPYQFPEKLIPNIIVKLINRHKINIYGNGKNIREWIHVGETCKYIESVCKKGIAGESFNIGSGIRINNLKISHLICKIFDKRTGNKNSTKLISHVIDRPAHDKSYFLNSKKIYKINRSVAQNNLEINLEQTLDWYLANNKWMQHCSRIYSGKRIGTLK